MRLYLMRHATAVPQGTPGCVQDADRVLTAEGKAEATAVAQGLQRLRIVPDLIVTSPYIRAIETAEQVRRLLQPKLSCRQLDELRSEADPRATSIALKTLSAYEELLLVGHEPHLSAWVAELVSGHEPMRCQMKKAAVACVEIERVPPPAGSGTLRWLMTPKQLALIGEAP